MWFCGEGGEGLFLWLRAAGRVGIGEGGNSGISMVEVVILEVAESVIVLEC